jgi:hypothetical protein
MAAGKFAKAIESRCHGCVYDPQVEGNWLDQVKACESTDCPLFPFRPRKDDRAAELVSENKGSSPAIQRWSKMIRERQAKNTPANAVAAYCIDCTVDVSEPGSWREQVGKNCHHCELASVRPR